MESTLILSLRHWMIHDLVGSERGTYLKLCLAWSVFVWGTVVSIDSEPSSKKCLCSTPSPPPSSMRANFFNMVSSSVLRPIWCPGAEDPQSSYSVWLSRSDLPLWFLVNFTQVTMNMSCVLSNHQCSGFETISLLCLTNWPASCIGPLGRLYSNFVLFSPTNGY